MLVAPVVGAAIEGVFSCIHFMVCASNLSGFWTYPDLSGWSDPVPEARTFRKTINTVQTLGDRPAIYRNCHHRHSCCDLVFAWFR